MVFIQKRCPSVFSYWLVVDRSSSWTDLMSPISKFRDIHFIDPARDIICWKFEGDLSFGVAMTSVQFFSEVRSLDVTWWPDLEWPGSEIFTCAEKCMHRYAKNGGAPTRLRSTMSQKLLNAVAYIFTRLQPSASTFASLPGSSPKKRETVAYLPLDKFSTYAY